MGLALALAGLTWALARAGRADVAAPTAPPADRVVVEVLNGSTRTGLARQVTRVLRTRGLDVIYFGTAARATDSTLVLVRRGDLANGYAAARALGQGVVRAAPDTLLRVDVSILLGRDYRPASAGPPL